MNAWKVTGFSSPQRLEDIMGSHLVDVAHVAHAEPGVAIIQPDDPTVLIDHRDPDWFRRVVLSVLHAQGESAAQVEPTSWRPTMP